MIRITSMAMALAVAAAPAVAQVAPSLDAREAARGYVESRAMQDALDELLSTETFVAQLEDAGLRLDPRQTETLEVIVAEEFAGIRPDLEDAMTIAAADAFTIEELEALNAFYGSKEGQSIAAKMRPFMLSFYTEIGPTLLEAQNEIAARAQEALTAGNLGTD